MFPLRDIVVTLGTFGAVPYILKNPYIGILMWNLFAFLYPHRYTWAFAKNFRFSLVVAAATILSYLMYKGHKRIPWCGASVLMVVLCVWVSITTIMAINPAGAVQEWTRFLKIILFVMLGLSLIDSREKIDGLVWIICLSLGFFGFKGGLFTIAHGGIYPVGGPSGSFIEENNEMAFALIMCLPLIRYLYLTTKKKYQHLGITVVILLTVVAIIGSYSRGAFVAGGAMVFVLWLRSRRRFMLFITFFVVIMFMFSFMPQQWHNRMSTIQTYEQDSSAMGRINAWWAAWYMALDNPILGGGARAFTPSTIYRYAPNPLNYHDVHSIYFEMLGEQGFVGLFIFLSIFFLAFLYAQQVRRLTKEKVELQWAFDLASMCQVSLVGYAVGGAFLGLAYWDLPYTIVAIIVLTKTVVEKEGLENKMKKGFDFIEAKEEVAMLKAK